MRENHPYGTFIPKGCHSMIIGSFPIGKFTHPGRRDEIKEHEINFFFGGEKNLLWRLIGDTFGRKLRSKKDIVDLLTEQHIGIGDVIKSCVRNNGGGSDKDLLEIEWNTELLSVIEKHKIKRVFFTGTGVEKWFRKLYPEAGLEMITLVSPSAQSARALGRRPEFRAWRKKNPALPVYEFILISYKNAFDCVSN